jgi:predicted permease
MSIEEGARSMRRLSNLWRNLVHRSRIDGDLDAELGSAFDLLVEEKVRAGCSRDAARRAAALEFGRVEVVKEKVRDARTGASVAIFLQDLRYGMRLLRRNPLFALTAGLSLAIGIGANTTIFTLANALLFRAPSGVSEPDNLVDISRREEGNAFANFTFSYLYHRDLRSRATLLADVYAFEFEPHPITLRIAESTEQVFANTVTTNYFETLGVRPAVGRLFGAGDSEAEGASPMVVLSYRFWQRRFNRDPDILGRTLVLNRRPFTVVGIAREGFRGTTPIAPDVWVPIGMVTALQPDTLRLTARFSDGMGMGGRLKPGVSLSQLQAELDAIARTLERENAVDDGTRMRAGRLSSIPGPVATVLTGFFALLLGLVSIVLVIACANIASVLLARAVARRKEIAVRVAIGAGRRRLVRQLLTETLLVFAIGGTGGFFLARVLTSMLIALLPALPVPVEISLSPDIRVVLFTMALSCLAAVLSGLAPALHASRADVVAGLKDESQGPSDRLRMRNVFVVAQVACSITLVILAGLLIQALDKSSAVNRGFDPRRVEIATLDLSRAGYPAPSGALFAQQLLDQLRRLPGVESATIAGNPPAGGGALARLTVPGVPPPGGEPHFTALWNAVDSDYFSTLRIPSLGGRDFTASDRTGSPPVAIVSQAVARRLWPNDDAVGKFIVWHDTTPTGPPLPTRVQIVGVVADLASSGRIAAVRELRAGRPGAGRPQPPVIPQTILQLIYVPIQQRGYTPRLTILARSAGRTALGGEIRKLVSSMDADLPMVMPQSLESRSGPGDVQLRIAASVAGSVGLVGLLLAAIGIYGVTAYTTVRRTREIGVRLALGATRREIMRMVLAQGLWLVALGSLIGLGLAAGGSRLFAHMLRGVPTLDPLTFGSAALLFAVIGIVASYVPAWRATRIDAIEALRYE